MGPTQDEDTKNLKVSEEAYFQSWTLLKTSGVCLPNGKEFTEVKKVHNIKSKLKKCMNDHTVKERDHKPKKCLNDHTVKERVHKPKP